MKELELLNQISGFDVRGERLCEAVDACYGQGAWEGVIAAMKDAERWRAMRQTLVAADFAPEMGGGPVVMFACHAERVGFGPDGADAIADAAVAAMQGANNYSSER